MNLMKIKVILFIILWNWKKEARKIIYRKVRKILVIKIRIKIWILILLVIMKIIIQFQIIIIIKMKIKKVN